MSLITVTGRDDMDDMGGMGGMDMNDEDWPTTNRAYAKGYWYFIVAAVALFLVIRAINLALNWLRHVSPVDGHHDIRRVFASLN